MYLTGFADEVDDRIDGQIRVMNVLGWRFIEARTINGTNITDIEDSEFYTVCEKLHNAGIKVSCLGSAIGNWSKQIHDPFDITIDEVNRAISRMQYLGTNIVRIMSYAVIPGKSVNEQMEEERFRRLKIITDKFLDSGIVPLHENCQNYGGMGWKYTLRLLDNVPGLKLVFDIGNPVYSDDRSKPEPCPKQSSWEFYSNVKEHIAYLHVKDGFWDEERKQTVGTFPGEGQADIRRILQDMVSNGYDGGVSIEPHIHICESSSGCSLDEIRFDNFVKYGRMMESMIDDIRTELNHYTLANLLDASCR